MSFLAEERKQLIYDTIMTDGQVRVAELARRFEVTSETIRKDLEELSVNGQIRKVHGGAIRLQQAVSEPAMSERIVRNQAVKERIARTAAREIQQDGVVFIDEGTTPLMLTDALPSEANLTVVTHSFVVAEQMMKRINNGTFSGELLFLGGFVSALHGRTSGTYAERMARDLYVDYAFISLDAIGYSTGLLSYDSEKAILSQQFIRNARQTYALFDQSKIDATANFRFAALDDIGLFICDIPAPQEWTSVHPRWKVASKD
ncbi:MAG: DeoR/GlpR family DNA-binding transcription regulator [Bacilli bacterium]